MPEHHFFDRRGECEPIKYRALEGGARFGERKMRLHARVEIPVRDGKTITISTRLLQCILPLTYILSKPAIDAAIDAMRI
jgi:hypothetical protein